MSATVRSMGTLIRFRTHLNKTFFFQKSLLEIFSLRYLVFHVKCLKLTTVRA